LKKILFISAIQKVPWGGSEELWSRAAAILSQQKKYEVVALVKKWAHRHHRVTQLAEQGVKVKEYEQGRKARLLNRIGLSSSLKTIRKIKPDVIIVSQGSYYDGKDWLEACSRSGISYLIVTQAAAETWWQDDNSNDILRCSFQKAARTIFVSLNNKDIIQAQLGCNLNNALIVNNAFNLSGDIMYDYPKHGDNYILACVGRLTANAKGQDLIINVLSSEKWKRRNLTVYLYGEGENERGLKKLAKTKEADNIVFKGFIEDVKVVWKECQGLLLPSRHEGLPLSAIEAMMCERMVIASKAAGGELVTEGLNGYLLEFPTIKSLDAVLEKAWQNRENWEQMGTEAGSHIMKILKDPAEHKLAQEIERILAAI
jgi:glycosyltransferase involved in cell wall biosynthesis